MTTLTEAARNIEALTSELAAHTKAAADRTAELKGAIARNHEVLTMSAAGVDQVKIALAETILSIRGEYAKGGDERASCVRDAVKQLAAGSPSGPYHDLWRQYFGTKSYDRWYGQRCDCEYGCGPRHGGIIFAIELTCETRQRQQSDLTADEIEAAIYYLTNLERIQAARKAAKEAA
jgi:hypothetical protein